MGLQYKNKAELARAPKHVQEALAEFASELPDGPGDKAKEHAIWVAKRIDLQIVRAARFALERGEYDTVKQLLDKLLEE